MIMSNPLQWLRPAPRPPVEVFAVYQATYEFHRELQYREALEQYCAWYDEVSATHRRELEQMRKDVNIFGWFNRRSG